MIACVVWAAGGSMDAYSFLEHGRVFANAQTGNIVFFAVYASGRQWRQAARHLPPIAAFALRGGCAKLLGVQSERRTFRATLLCQVFELVILSTLAGLGKFLPDACVVPIISFIAAIQNTSFGKIGPWSFNSAMSTGNLRSATSELVLWIAGRETEKNRSKAIALGLVSSSFLTGAPCGAMYTRLDESHALMPCAAILAMGLALTWRERRRRIDSPFFSSPSYIQGALLQQGGGI